LSRLDNRRCYIITLRSIAGRFRPGTRGRPLSHHHHAPGAHPVTVAPSILRLSAWQRLAFVAAIVACLWAAVLWAMA